MQILIKIVIVIFLHTQMLYAVPAGGGGTTSNSALPDSIRIAIEEDNFFDGAYVLQGIGVCQPACRALSSDMVGLTTKIVDFDATTGITFCKVYLQNNESLFGTDLSLTANTLNQKCVNDMESIQVDTTAGDDVLASKSSSASYGDLSAQFQSYEPSRITLSRFVGGLATLDTDYINLTDTETTQQLVRTDEANDAIFLMDNTRDSTGRLLSITDSLSSSNMAFYASLFYHLDSVYEYLVSYVFVFISLFFIVFHASKMMLKKLEKKSTAFDEGWKSKLAVVVASVSIFFLPVRFDDNYSSTIFQNIWTYFVQESSSIADRTNGIAAQALVRGVFSTAGVSGVEEEASLLALKDKEDLKKIAYKSYLEDYCQERFPDEGGFQSYDQNKINHLESLAYDDPTLDSVTYASCRTIEKKYNVSLSTFSNYDYNINRIKSSYEDGKLRERLERQATDLAQKVRDLGWYSAILAPSVSISTKINFLLDEDNAGAKQELHVANSMAVNTSQIANSSHISEDDTLSQALKVSPDKDKDFGASMGTFIYYILPGVGHMKRAMDNVGSTLADDLLKQLGMVNKNLVDKSVANISGFLDNNKKHDAKLKSHFALVSMIKALLMYVPLLIAIVGGLIVVVMYLYELVVFSFITPFIVAFAITSGQARKILDFLIMALSLFLKPVLIVIFIYLSVFLYNFVENFMTIMVNEQFIILAEASDMKFTSFMIVFLMELLNLLIVIFSSMFLWRVIMGGPSFTYKMVGLDKVDNTTQMASGVQQSMGRYGFRV